MKPGDRIEILLTIWYARQQGLGTVFGGTVAAVSPKAVEIDGTTILRTPPTREGAIPCRLCSKPLTDPASQSIGYGPDCMVHVGLTNKFVRDLGRSLSRDEIQTAERHLARRLWVPLSQIRAQRQPGDAVLEEARLKRQIQQAERTQVKQEAHAVAVTMRHEEISDEPLPIALPFDLEPRPYQWRAVRFMLEVCKRGVNPSVWDLPGVGKTPEAIVFLMLASTGLAAQDKAGPSVVICPPVMTGTWERMLKTWWQGSRVQILKGYEPKKKIDKRADVYILSWSILAQGWEPMRDSRGNIIYRNVKQKDGTVTQRPVSDTSKVILSGNLREVIALHPRIVIVDEAHNGKEPTTQRSMALAQLALPAEYTIPMTGTAVLNRTSELVTQLDLTGVLTAEFGGRDAFEKEFAGKHLAYVPGTRRRAWAYSPITGSKLVELHRRLTPYVIRRRTKDVIKDMPSLTIARVEVELANRAEYNKLEEEIYGLPPAMRLGKLMQLRQLCGLGKLVAAQAWIAEFLENEEKLIAFATHQAIQLGLVEEFKKWNPAVILGRSLGSTDRKRQEAMDRFQQDESCLLAILSSGAAREGITLTAGKNILDIELEWTPGIQDQKWGRSFRYGQHDPVTVWVLAAAETMDDTLLEKLADKRRITGEIMDGRAEVLTEDILKQAIISDLVRRVARRRKKAKIA